MGLGIILEVGLFLLVVWTFFLNLFIGFFAFMGWLYIFPFAFDGVMEVSTWFTEPIKGENSEDEKATNKSELVGKTGKTISALRPMGTIEIDGEQMEAKAFSGFLDQNEEVVISAVEQNNLLVKIAAE